MRRQTTLAPDASEDALLDAFEEASTYDPTLAVGRRDLARLRALRVAPERFTRDRMFRAMLNREPCVLRGHPRPACGALAKMPLDDAATGVMDWLGKRKGREKFRVYTGPTGVPRKLTLRDIAKKWDADAGPFGVTDLHIRHSNMEDIIAPDVISGFNLLPHSTPGAQQQEMFSFVISATGQVTDSHSDAPDSTNYCFTGKKLWLAWDTYDGMRHGLQDVERVSVKDKAIFDMKRWMSLPSARWCLVNPGETLFLPAHLTHKVVTLERYIGVGGFYLSLPNCLHLLRHWIVRPPLWTKRDRTGESAEILGQITDSLAEKIVTLRTAPKAEQKRWGYDYLQSAVEVFIDTCPEAHFELLWGDPRFRSVARVIDADWPLPHDAPTRWSY